MKVIHKLHIFMVVGLIIMLFFFGYFSYQREINQFESDLRRNAQVLGHALSAVIRGVWRTRGQMRALALIYDTNAGQSVIHTRWVWLDGTPEAPYRPRFDLKTLAPLKRGKEVVVRRERADGTAALYTYIPAQAPDGRLGALELSESLSGLRAYTRASAERLVVMTGILIIAGSIFISIVGQRMIGRRIRRLAQHARRIGEGDLSSQLPLHGNDEITELEDGMNAMALQLQAAQDKLLQETEARIRTLAQLRHTGRLATLGRLSAGMAHELGTPLNVIAGRAKLISTEDLDREEVLECAKIIEDQSVRMTDIIRQLLEFARRRAPKKSPVDIHRLTRRVLEILQPIAGEQHVTLQFDNRVDTAVAVVDSSQIQQVLINILINGIQVMPDGGRLEVVLDRKRVRPPLQEGGEPGDYLVLSVTDEGTGIPEEDIDHIFEPFFTTKEVGKGTGLGLSIAYGIIQEHHGWIDAESAHGAGACFTVYLPVEEGQADGSSPDTMAPQPV